MNKIRLTFPQEQSSGNSNRIVLPPAIGRGIVETMNLNSGIRLAITDYQLNQPTIMEYNHPANICGFGFCLSGDIETHPACFKDAFSVRSGQSAFYNFREADETIEKTGTERVVRISILMDHSEPFAFAVDEVGSMPLLLRELSAKTCRITDVITPVMQTALLQILECPYHGIARNLFIEGKVLELIAHKMDQLESASQGIPNRYLVKADDVDRVWQAACLLTRDLENAPNLTELARSVGMSRSKLHQCFKAVYGITPFEYLRNRRLETAERLLREGEMNVTETACAVGYASLSHFIKAFKQHFGDLPGGRSRQI